VNGLKVLFDGLTIVAAEEHSRTSSYSLSSIFFFTKAANKLLFDRKSSQSYPSARPPLPAFSRILRVLFTLIFFPKFLCGKRGGEEKVK
jgi:hypothetical protein